MVDTCKYKKKMFIMCHRHWGVGCVQQLMAMVCCNKQTGESVRFGGRAGQVRDWM